MDLKEYIRDVPDFPKPGILFKDITTLLGSKEAFNHVIEQLEQRYRDMSVDVVVGVEARGFIIGAAVATKLGAAFVPVRKPGKLPWKTYKVEYELEYGTDALEVHQDAIPAGCRTLLLDDLLATGGTTEATLKLLDNFDTEIVEVAFLIELEFLQGRKRLKDYPIYAMMSF